MHIASSNGSILSKYPHRTDHQWHCQRNLPDVPSSERKAYPTPASPKFTEKGTRAESSCKRSRQFPPAGYSGYWRKAGVPPILISLHNFVNCAQASSLAWACSSSTIDSGSSPAVSSTANSQLRGTSSSSEKSFTILYKLGPFNNGSVGTSQVPG